MVVAAAGACCGDCAIVCWIVIDCVACSKRGTFGEVTGGTPVEYT